MTVENAVLDVIPSVGVVLERSSSSNVENLSATREPCYCERIAEQVIRDLSFQTSETFQQIQTVDQLSNSPMEHQESTSDELACLPQSSPK